MATVATSIAYDYDEASRLEGVSDGVNSAAYSYLANSPLVTNIWFTNNTTLRMTTTRSYDLLNRLTGTTSAAGGSNVAVFNYSYNTANQRTTITNVDNSRWVYQYDSLGQVISGKKYWADGTAVAGQQFEYGFDDIGNRKTTGAGGDVVGASLRLANYTNNNLKQITSRSVPGFVNVLGTAKTNATVTLWGDNGAFSGTSRRGEYFRGELNADNSGNPVYLSVTTLAVLTNGTNPDIVTNTVGKKLLAMTPQDFTYDADGNQTSDSLWTSLWNAENRRVTIESVTDLPAEAKFKEEWKHLADGRWIERIVSTNDDTSYYPAFTNRYVWDKQVLLAVLDHTNGVVVSFVRGLDLSGSIQGAGGVGGVLAVKAGSSAQCGAMANTTHFTCYDGNGNVTVLVNAADGSESARYEYAPFAERLRETGPMAKLNPIRFSTQYTDDVIRDVKYLFRDYDADTGRWLSRDPIAENGGLNLYGFVGNEPTDLVDPFGLIKYDFNKKKCVLKVTLTWSLKFENQTGFPNWTYAQRSQWKRDAERAVENYFKNVPLRCYPATTACCLCPGGASVDFNLRYKGFFTFWRNDDYVVTVLPDPNHRSWVSSTSGSGTAEFDINDVNPQNKGASQPQVPVVHETGHQLGLDHPGGANNSAGAYQADYDSLMGGGMILRLPDFNKAFCDKISTGSTGCDPWKGR